MLGCQFPRCGGGELNEKAKFYVNGVKVDYSTNIDSHLYFINFFGDNSLPIDILKILFYGL